MSFGMSGDGSGPSTSWFFGRSKHNLTPSSPATGSPAAPSVVAETPNAAPQAADDIAFAESFGQEASPLFNPDLMPRSDAPGTTTEAAHSLGLSPNTPGIWNWQSTVGGSNNLSHRSSPLSSAPREQSPDLSTHIGATESPEFSSGEEPPVTVSRDASPLQESAAQSIDGQAAGAEETRDTSAPSHTDAHDEIDGNDVEAESSSKGPNEDNQAGPADAEPADDARSPSADLPDDVPPSSARRPRRSGAEMLSAAAQSFVKNVSGPRRRVSAYPASPAPKATPAAARRSRKSMPARIDATTPKKRGRPRKSEIAATPATTAPGTAKRGRPRKSDAPASAIKTPRPATTPRRAASAAKSVAKSGRKATAATPNAKANRVSLALGTPFPATVTPKRRGRPPKIPQTAEATPAKRGRKPAQARAAPSPAKRGRPKKVAVPAPKPAARGRKPAAKHTAKAAATTASTEPPKRRGRPPKSATAPKTDESVQKPITKKRGRGAAASEDPAPSTGTKRGRPKRSEVEPPAAEASEPPAKRQRTIRQTQEPAAPVAKVPRGASKAEAKSDSSASTKTTRSGRQAATKQAAPEPKRPVTKTAKAAKETAAPVRKPGRGAVKDTSATKNNAVEVPQADVVEAPKSRTRARGAAQTPAEKPAEKAASKTRGRAAKSGKGELPSSKPAAEEEAPKRTKSRGTAAPTRVEKAGPAAVGTRRSARSKA